MGDVLKAIKGGLIVSCQALEHEPLHGPHIMRKMSAAAIEGGAIGIRCNSPQDISAIKEEVQVPIIGLYKQVYSDSSVYITPTLKEVDEVVAAGADIVATDATKRLRPYGETLEEFMQKVRSKYPKLLLMADVSNLEEAITAEKLGFDLVSTTMAGYTEYTQHITSCDMQLLKEALEKLSVPVLAEGRVKTPEEAAQCMKIGAYAVIVGSAITRPQEITKDFVSAITSTKK